MDNKIVVITGGSSGIGRALCDCFIDADYKVAIASRSENLLEKVKSDLSSKGHEILTLKTDVRVDNDCKNLVDKVIEKYGRIDVFINNAGITWYESDEDGINIEKHREILDTNHFGTVQCTKYALPHLLKSKGSLVGVCSIAGEVGLPNRSAYSASKFAMNGFLSSLRVQYLNKGLHVLITYVGYTSTNIRKIVKDDYKSSQFPPGYGEAVKEKGMMSAEETARYIFNGVKKRKRYVRPTSVGQLTVWLNKLFPKLNDKLAAKYYN
jgi:short-subunit dehydrogenase